MKKLVFALVVLLTAFMSTNAQVGTKPAPEVDPNGPKIEFKKVLHNYGTIENGADGTCEFKFKNTGKKPLKISNCRASCGCTIPSWPREEIKPGKSSTIKVKYDTKRTGGIHKTITITSNAINEPRKVLTIKGQIKAPKNALTKQTAAQKAAAQKLAAEKKAQLEAQKAAAEKVAAEKAAAEAAEKARIEKSKRKRWYQFWKKKA